MKLFAAIAKKEALEVARDIGYRHILVSYFYIKKCRMLEMIRQMNSNHEFFLDSGAHSANTIGAVITRKELTAFTKEHSSLFKIYAGLDDIKSHRITLVNQKKMEADGLSPLITFHYGEPLSVLSDYIKSYDFIALGGAVGRTKTEKIGWLDILYGKILSRHKEKKIHMFGIHDVDILSRYPFYSADASSDSLMASNGGVLVDGKSVKYRDIPLKHRTASGLIELQKNNDSRISLTDREKARYRTLLLKKQKLEVYITQLWTKRGITWKD
jgi:hypothetical protein